MQQVPQQQGSTTDSAVTVTCKFKIVCCSVNVVMSSLPGQQHIYVLADLRFAWNQIFVVVVVVVQS